MPNSSSSPGAMGGDLGGGRGREAFMKIGAHFKTSLFTTI